MLTHGLSNVRNSNGLLVQNYHQIAPMFLKGIHPSPAPPRPAPAPFKNTTREIVIFQQKIMPTFPTRVPLHTLPNTSECNTVETKCNKMQQGILLLCAGIHVLLCNSMHIRVVVAWLICGTINSARCNKVDCKVQHNATPI